MSMPDLPLSFVDAIEITRKLGFKYLWIDSLCIIQDNEVDWVSEVASMGAIFANAFCTIAAASSSSSSEGCRVQTRLAKRTHFADIQLFNQRVRVFEKYPEDWNVEYSINPLQRRAWVLQERLLSRRTVNFSQNMLLWECATAKASGELPWFKMRNEDPREGVLLNDVTESHADPGTFAQRQKWFETVEAYSHMCITHESDRLPAVAGLVSKAQPRGHCIAGMWTQDMPAAFLWYTKFPMLCKWRGTPRRPIRERAPSWSWASVEGEISYASQRFNGSAEDQPAPAVDYMNASFVFQGVCAPCHTQPTSPSNSVQIGASVTATGSIQTGRLEVLRPLDIESPDYKLVTEDGLAVGILLPDVSNEVSYGISLQCLPVRSEADPRREYHDMYDLYGTDDVHELNELNLLMGLALQSVAGGEGTFRRVGLLRLARKSWFDGCPQRRISII
ncbi:hypothetical protein PMZ80_005607 [Knufia obscura]|uniref:Heterokaryon incompatibility domain-containing protein n=2 Tax=Knufia TaxID=430999 RepID=A0AAN8EGX8_9EURO|nr:hypothetical protein PMZ80_005607 [Knufia obscura]KAK5949365.1 hypothetical protein OHC33_009537 [Knufia fluminis]